MLSGTVHFILFVLLFFLRFSNLKSFDHFNEAPKDALVNSMRELLDYCRSIINFNVCFAVVLTIVLCAKVTVRFVLKYVLYAGPFLHQ